MSNMTFQQAKELEELSHKNKMQQLEYIRGTEKLKHMWEQERFRIVNAEKKKYLIRKQEYEKEKLRRENHATANNQY